MNSNVQTVHFGVVLIDLPSHFKNYASVLFQNKEYTSGVMVLVFGDTQVQPPWFPPV